MGNREIVVSTEELLAKANEVETIITHMEINFEELTTYVDGTKSYWVGPGGDAKRALYESYKDDIAEILKRLKEHPIDLQTMAGEYVAAETKSSETARALAGDVIV